MSATTIKEKALRCIDEVYPSDSGINDTHFPVEQFLSEAVRWVIDVLPLHILTIRDEASAKGGDIVDGVVTYLSDDLRDARLVYFKMEDWIRPADIIFEDSPLYRQQKNRILRGTPSRPVVVRMMDDTKVEAYTSNSDSNQDSEVYVVKYDAANIPAKAEDLCAWKLAEIVLLSMSDAQNASVCTARVSEILEQLAL